MRKTTFLQQLKININTFICPTAPNDPISSKQQLYGDYLWRTQCVYFVLFFAGKVTCKPKVPNVTYPNQERYIFYMLVPHS